MLINSKRRTSAGRSSSVQIADAASLSAAAPRRQTDALPRPRIQSDRLPEFDPSVERRRASRVRSGPLRVLLETGAEGTLIDLNEFGARLELPSAERVDTRLTFDLFWENVPVRLHGRVVRTTPCFDADARVAWGEPASYHVAVEFFDIDHQCAITLHDVILQLSRRLESLQQPEPGRDKA